MTNPEKISGPFFLALSIVILIQSLRLPFGSISQPESGFFPTIISVLLIIFSLALLGNSFLRKSPEKIDFGGRYDKIGITVAAMILYAFLVNPLGYLLCTFLAGIVVMKWVQKRSWRAAFSFSVLYSAISYFGFQMIGVLLPRGIISFL